MTTGQWNDPPTSLIRVIHSDHVPVDVEGGKIMRQSQHDAHIYSHRDDLPGVIRMHMSFLGDRLTEIRIKFLTEQKCETRFTYLPNEEPFDAYLEPLTDVAVPCVFGHQPASGTPNHIRVDPFEYSEFSKEFWRVRAEQATKPGTEYHSFPLIRAIGRFIRSFFTSSHPKDNGPLLQRENPTEGCP